MDHIIRTDFDRRIRVQVLGGPTIWLSIHTGGEPGDDQNQITVALSSDEAAQLARTLARARIASALDMNRRLHDLVSS